MAVPTSPKRERRGNSLSDSAAFELSYPGKSSVEDILATTPRVPRKESVFGSEPRNQLYHADNLPVLAALLQDPDVVGKVKLIYIDPPFATAGSFESRSLAHAYDDHLVGVEFVEFLRKRLVLLHRLLADDGSIYLHLDSRMISHMRIVLDEIFGADNFRAMITRKKCSSKNYTRKSYGNVSDHILFYSKSSRYVWNRPYQPWEEEHALREYPYIDSEGRRHKRVPIHAPGVRNGETGQEWRGMLPPPGKHWQYKLSTLDSLDEKGDIYWSSNGNPRRKLYLDESPGVAVQDIWLDVRDAHNQNVRVTGYPTEKNLSLLRRVVEASSNPGDLVLDCFAGSGTTLVAADQLGRRWIGIDQGEEAISTILKRFESGSNRMGDFVNNNVGAAEDQHDQISDFMLFHS